MPIHVTIITPEKQIVSDDVDFIAAPSADGEIGILPRHTPLIAKLGEGEMRLKKGNETRHLALHGGFLEVQPGSRVNVFAETAELADQIDVERARLAAERAEAQLRNAKGQKEIDLIDAEAQLSRAMVRLRVARLRTGRKPGVR